MELKFKDRCSAIGAAYLMQRAVNSLTNYMFEEVYHCDSGNKSVEGALDYCLVVRKMLEIIEPTLRAIHGDGELDVERKEDKHETA